MKVVVGITGGIGTGKSSVLAILKQKGYTVLDCDKISHQVLQDKRLKQGYHKIVEIFGEDILDSKQNIDRKKLGAKVFNNKENKKILEDILHPIIKERLLKEIAKYDGIVFAEIPLLFETDFKDLCDKTVLVYADFDSQIYRVMKRDGLDFPTAIARIREQMPIDDKVALADLIVDNRYQEYDLTWQVDLLLKALKGEH